jgi:hypothetical protein
LGCKRGNWRGQCDGLWFSTYVEPRSPEILTGRDRISNGGKLLNGRAPLIVEKGTDKYSPLLLGYTDPTSPESAPFGKRGKGRTRGKLSFLASLL